MNSFTQKATATLILLAALSVSAFAQYTSSLKIVDLDAFNKADLKVDAEVILIKSTRNMITLGGDSAFIASLPMENKDSVLTINYEKEPGEKLIRIVIEYTGLKTAITGGSGTYYFHKIDEKGLKINNPAANVIVSGLAENIQIVSQKGTNDITKLQAEKMLVKLGEHATLIEKNENVFSALN